jgi:Holliday junction DNA helicase RuvA
MIDYISGVLAEKSAVHATIETSGVGYYMTVSLTTFQRLPAHNKTVKLFTHQHVREDDQRLFGFFTKSERDMFRKLITVSKIGPKVAMSILSSITEKELIAAIARSDTSRLKSVPGIGLKTAQRIVLDLKGKIDTGIADGMEEAGAVPAEKTGSGSGPRNEAYEALVTLGYNEKEVYKALTRVGTLIDPLSPVEEWIKRALQVV